MTYFIRNGSRFNVSAESALPIEKSLPVGTYTIKYDDFGGFFFLEMIEDYTLTDKVYGDSPRNSEKILNTFLERPNATGVMLSGEKGSGKTLLAKMLSVRAREQHGMPTIVINNAWFGEKFNVFIQSIEQPVVVIFDEFEKVYDREQQEALLTLLDGVYPSKKLYVLTCNDKYRVDDHMNNRPGRIFYKIEYSGIEESFIREYANDNLNNKDEIDPLVAIAGVFSKFNFDMLKALVEEMNRYDEPARESMKLLNTKPETTGGHEEFDYEVTLKDGTTLKGQWRGQPLAELNRFNIWQSSDVKIAPLDAWERELLAGSVDDDGDKMVGVIFGSNDLVAIENNAKVYRYTTSEMKVTLERRPARSLDYWDYV